MLCFTYFWQLPGRSWDPSFMTQDHNELLAKYQHNWRPSDPVAEIQCEHREALKVFNCLSIYGYEGPGTVKPMNPQTRNKRIKIISGHVPTSVSLNRGPRDVLGLPGTACGNRSDVCLMTFPRSDDF